MLSSEGLYPGFLPKTCTPICCSVIASVFPLSVRSQTYKRKFASRADRVKLELAAIRRARSQRGSPAGYRLSQCGSSCNSGASVEILSGVVGSRDQGVCWFPYVRCFVRNLNLSTDRYSCLTGKNIADLVSCAAYAAFDRVDRATADLSSVLV